MTRTTTINAIVTTFTTSTTSPLLCVHSRMSTSTATTSTTNVRRCTRCLLPLPPSRSHWRLDDNYHLFDHQCATVAILTATTSIVQLVAQRDDDGPLRAPASSGACTNDDDDHHMATTHLRPIILVTILADLLFCPMAWFAAFERAELILSVTSVLCLIWASGGASSSCVGVVLVTSLFSHVPLMGRVGVSTGSRVVRTSFSLDSCCFAVVVCLVAWG
ncbi:hypothetical protein SCLCIDRAFT_1218839 [Scleroderma citrinum Foug A]|uniref:Uncharacterized protein n=1 Tax=Scleroderma citrinum Foug A TaxID=1036808 RepID=A0A0C3DQF2_9AGAM|nr:hypothetical protein SCLCIDRAFT_1218839 [Scleroderma citrinum Foug A]